MKKILILVSIFSLLAIIGFLSMGQKELPKEPAMQAILDKTADGKKIFGTSFALKQGDFYWEGASGNLSPDQPYFIASVTKLFTSAIILQLRAEGALELDDKISVYLDSSQLRGLHVYQGKEYSYDLTIRQLLAHTSGLPDYFEGEGANGRSLKEELISGKDRATTFEQALEHTKEMEPLFAPATPGKANYSDTNYQLLGKMIESITQQPFVSACEARIIQPLGLSQTYLYQDSTDQRPRPFSYKTQVLHIPQAMLSFGPDGGIVSTSRELLTFLEAFFTGKLFPAEYIEELQEWNPIFNPMRSGVGIQLMKLPWVFDPTRSMPDLIGHIGLSGVVAFYSPEDDLFVVGTVNQIAYPSTAIQTAFKLLREAKKGA